MAPVTMVDEQSKKMRQVVWRYLFRPASANVDERSRLCLGTRSGALVAERNN